VQISVFPSLDLVAEDVSLAQSGDGTAAEMARAKSLRIGLQLSALLGGKVKLTEVTLPLRVRPSTISPSTSFSSRTAP
jgi:AsmA protein